MRLIRGAVPTAACVAAALALTGCGGGPSGPKAKDSAVKMAKDANWLAAKYRGYFKPTASFTVSQDATKPSSCGHGKARYSFAGHQSFTIAGKNYLDITTTSDSWMKSRGYALDSDAKPTYEFSMRNSQVLVDKKNHIHLTVKATAASEQATTELWTITGQTDCLRTG